MSKIQRLKNIVLGLIMILIGVVMIWFPEEGYVFVTLILSFSLILSGLRSLAYYLLMARHMVGGKSILVRGIILLDLGLFTLTLTDIPKIYVILYLLGCHIFAGMVDIMRAVEAKRYKARLWRYNLAYGIANLSVAVSCLACIRSTGMLVVIYCTGMIYSACVRIVSAFRRTAIVYIS